jgi:hypothetical protein
MTGMFNIQAANYGFWFLIAVIISRRTGEADEEVEWDEADEPTSELGELEAVTL